MKYASKIDLGSVQVHKHALAEIASYALSEIDGVSLIPKNPLDYLLELTGYKGFPGIVVKVYSSDDVSMEVKVRIRYGLNIPDMSRYIQSTVRSAIEKTTNIHLKDINVNIQGIERRAE